MKKSTQKPAPVITVGVKVSKQPKPAPKPASKAAPVQNFNPFIPAPKPTAKKAKKH